MKIGPLDSKTPVAPASAERKGVNNGHGSQAAAAQPEPSAKVELSAASLCLYAGFKGSASELGLPKTNYWVYPSADHDGNVQAFESRQSEAMPLIYISFPSAKDPSWDARYPHKSTVEIVAPTLPQWFEQWKGSTWGKRGEDYEAFKAQLTEQLLETLYRFQPQLREHLDFCELGTPLSTEWFQWNEQGEIYGIEHTVQRFDQHWTHSQTPIRGLYLTGADTVGPQASAGSRSGCSVVASVLTKACSRARKSQRSMRQPWPLDGSQRTRFTELGTPGRSREDTAVPACTTHSRRACPCSANV